MIQQNTTSLMNRLSPPGQFNFELSPAQEERAKRLHRESIVVDLVSQHAGGNIFAHYPAQLQAEFRASMKGSSGGIDGLTEATYWPYEMSRQGKSDLIRDWFLES